MSLLNTLNANIKIMTLEGEIILGFGKYKDLTYKAVYERDAGYCKWCKKQVAKNFQMICFQCFIFKMDSLTGRL